MGNGKWAAEMKKEAQTPKIAAVVESQETIYLVIEPFHLLSKAAQGSKDQMSLYFHPLRLSCAINSHNKS